MKNTTKFMGIIALAAVIGFSMAGCGGPEGGPTGDTTAPALSAGSVSRTSDTQAIIGFTTSEAGTAYYLVAAANAAAPANTAVKAGTPLGAAAAGANSKMVTLTAGAKDIYVVVEDSSGNISVPLKIAAAAHSGGSGPITYTAVQTGGTNGMADSTGIVFTFSESVDSLGLSADDITIDGAAAKGQSALSGTGATRTLAITVSAEGNATVSINKTGVEAGTKNVPVYKVDPNYASPGLQFYLINSNTEYGVRRDPSAPVTSGALYIPNFYTNPNTQQTLPVTEIAAQAFYNTNITAVYIPENVKTIGQQAFAMASGNTSSLTTVNIAAGSRLQSIGYNAFSGCGSLTGITIPENVTTIGSGAFENCTSLTDIIIDTDRVTITEYSNWSQIFPAGNFSVTFKKNTSSYAFYQCNRLTSLTISEGVTGIGVNAFNSCSRLTSVTISEGVRGIGYRAFRYCANLTTVNIAANSQLQTIGEQAFSYTGLTEITIPVGVTTIDQEAFSFTPLTTIMFAANSQLATIKQDAFRNSRLTSITIPAGVTSIDSSAFYRCTSLTTVNIAANSQLQTIGGQAFYQCTSLTEITIPADVWYISSDAFYDCTGLTSVTFAEGFAMTIGSWFSGLSNITTVNIPASVTSIADGEYVSQNRYRSAFSGCTGLTTVNIAANSQLATIGSYAFSDCTGLTGITIPASVTSIDERAFSGCTGLTSVTFLANVSFDSSAFYGDLYTKYHTATGGGPGTYTTTAPVNSSSVWTKQ